MDGLVINISGLIAFSISSANKYLNTGLKACADIETARKITVLNLFALVGFTITLTLCVHAILQAEYPLALSLILASSAFIASHLCLRFLNSPKAVLISSFFLQFVLIILCLYLVYGGGTNNTGPLWMYLVPPVVLFFSGLEKGLAVIFFFLMLYCMIMFVFGEQLNIPDYSYEFKTRILYSFATLTFLACYYEYSRQASYKKLIILTNELERQAAVDPLTQLCNRRGMLARIDYEAVKSERSKNGMVFLIADVDHFKHFNDNYGHDFGDAILVSLGKLFSGSVRKQDSIARWGGEEFLFLLPNTNIEQAEKIAEKIRKKVEDEIFSFKGLELKCTLCFGVAEVTDFKNTKLAIHVADQRLYLAKKHGRNRVVAKDSI